MKRTIRNFFFFFCLSGALMAQDKVQVIAHRGFWQSKGGADFITTDIPVDALKFIRK